MKKYLGLLLLLLSVAATMLAQQQIIIHESGGTTQSFYTSTIEDIRFAGNSSVFYMNDDSGDMHIPIAGIDSLTFEYKTTPPIGDGDTIYIQYASGGVEVINPYENSGVTVSVDGSHVSVAAATSIAGITYHLSGYTADGSFSINSDTDIVIVLEDTQLTSLTTPVINVGKAITATIRLQGTNQLADNATNAKNNAFASKGNLVFEGDGSLTLMANKKNGISSDLGLTIDSGTIRVDAKIDDGKAMKAEEDIVINGGNITLSVSGAQSKGISGSKNTYFNGANVQITASGTTVLEELDNGYDPSYCSGVKSDGDIYVTGGSVTIELTSTNNGGKGLTADGNIAITGGTVHITTAGDGSTYTDETGTKDSYSSCCIKSDVDISITGGDIYCSSTGKAGKGISADGTLTIGEEGKPDTDLNLEVRTSGERFLVTSGSGGGWPGGEDTSDYANPKAVKSEGDLTVNSGTIKIYCTQTDEGGEGLESKATLTVNGGDIHIEAYDDCINASDHIQINGGTVYCKSSGNDGIDSNGTITITGGLIISHGTTSPEGGFDCDQSRFIISGGTIIGTGGSTSTPTASASDQYSIVYNNATAGNAIGIKNSSGDYIFLFQLPTFSGNSGGGGGPGGGSSSSMVVLISNADITSGSYTLHYGGSIAGGTTVNGYTTGGTYSGGSSKSFTVSTNKVVTVR